MTSINSKNLLDKYNIFFVLMMLYVIVRAVAIPVIYDEAITYRSFVSSSIWSVVTCANADANNHILNSLLTKMFVAVLGNSVFVLRLTNILAFALYLFSASRIARLLIRESMPAFLLTMCLCLHPGLTDYFALCRGYGLSLALMMFSVYQVLKVHSEDNHKHHSHLALFSATLSVYSILSMLNFAVGVYLLVTVILYRKHKSVSIAKRLLRSAAIPFLHFLMMVALVAYPIYALNANDAFYWGGDSNFVKDTMLTMLQELMQERNPTVGHGLLVAFIAFIGIVAIFHITKAYLKDRVGTIDLVPPFLFLFCIFCINFQFYLLSVKFIIFRTALYLFPLFILTLFTAIKIRVLQKTRLILAALATAVLVLNFVPLLNTRYFFEAVSNSFSLEVISDISADAPQEKKVRLFSGLYEEPCLNYYISEDRSRRFYPAPYALLERSDLHGYDYLLLSGEESYKAPAYYRLMKVYGVNELYLFKNEEK